MQRKTLLMTKCKDVKILLSYKKTLCKLKVSNAFSNYLWGFFILLVCNYCSPLSTLGMEHLKRHRTNSYLILSSKEFASPFRIIYSWSVNIFLKIWWKFATILVWLNNEVVVFKVKAFMQGDEVVLLTNLHNHTGFCSFGNSYKNIDGTMLLKAYLSERGIRSCLCIFNLYCIK